jgi:hypothetical protein
MFVSTENTKEMTDSEQLHHAGKGDLHRQQAVRASSTETQDSCQQSPVIMRRKSSARANPAFRKSEGSRLLMGSVEGHQRNRAESEGGPGRLGSLLTKKKKKTTMKDYSYYQIELYVFILHLAAELCDHCT